MTSTPLRSDSVRCSRRHRGIHAHHGSAGRLLIRGALFSYLALLSACSLNNGHPGTPAQQLQTRSLTLAGADFPLYAVEQPGSGQRAHVFIEGDGRPWRSGGRLIADDPTPRRTPLLEQMRRTPGPALYLGRPCYFGQRSEACHPMLWTFSRYSEQVLQSMHTGLLQWLGQHPDIRELTLVGHSGGGILALLLAERIPQADAVIAMATPVDTDRWADLHGYTRLFGSINPARQPHWRPGVSRHLLYGQQDRQVPADIFLPIAQRIPEAQVQLVEDAGHGCCAEYQRFFTSAEL